MTKTIIWKHPTVKLEELTQQKNASSNLFQWFFQHHALTPCTLHLTDNIVLKVIILEGDAKGVVSVRRAENPEVLIIRTNRIWCITFDNLERTVA